MSENESVNEHLGSIKSCKRLNKINKEFIFAPEAVPFPVCHASNICVLKDGSILAAWFAGTEEGASDTAIWMSRKEAGHWSNPVLVAKDMEEAHWNPVIFQKEDGDILLFYKVGDQIKEWYTQVRISHDQGKSWSEPKELVQDDRGGRGPVRCKVSALSDHSMIAGTSTEDGIWRAYADKSVDGGENWELSGPIELDVVYDQNKVVVNSDIQVSQQSFLGRGVIQPSIWESGQGKVHMFLRSTEGCIYRSDSDDYGKTWCKAYPTELPNNNSGIDAVRCENGLLVLCSNPVPENWGKRTPLTLKVSHDNGRTWYEEIVLEDREGEYSYPCVLSAGENIYVSYTYNRETIAFCELAYEKI